METKVLRIPTEEAFRRTWSAPTTIISAADLDKADDTDGCALNDLRSTIEVVKRLNPSMPDIVIHPEQSSQGHEEVNLQNNYKSQTAQDNHIFRTPKKTHSSEYIQNLQKEYIQQESYKQSTSVIGDKSDWMIAERSHSRSPPSPALISRSPDVMSRSPSVRQSPSVQTHSNMFNFSPDRTELYRNEMENESIRVKKRLFDEMNKVSAQSIKEIREPVSPSYRTNLHSPTSSRRHHEIYLSPHSLPHHLSTRDLNARDHEQHELQPEVKFYLESPVSRSPSQAYIPDRETFRAKRRLDVDQDYMATPKRLKADFEREMGIRYMQQLDADMSAIRNKHCNQEVQKPTNCTCAIMEKHFLEMAESAYRSLRRNDTSPHGFEQFRLELIQTNDVIKDSMEVLKNIRSFCEHK